MDNKSSYPSFSGIMTFMRAPYAEISDLKSGQYAVAGVPFDTTVGSRPGARYAPNEIRKQSVHFIYHLSAVDEEVIDVCSKERYKWPPKDLIVDLGDLRVFPADVVRTTTSVAADISCIVAKGATPVVLGGDHYITYPVVKGFEQGMKKRLGRPCKIGYIHIDSHLDAYDENETWGRYYHGSPARRISELESISLKNMVWVGINGTTGLEPYSYITKNGGTIFTIDDIRREGIISIANKAAAIAVDGCDTIYLTIDIDVVDQAFACGTGSYIYGGISACELLEAVQALTKFNIGGIDIVEVAPNLDPTGNTSRLASSAVINFLKPKIFDIYI